MNWFKTFKNWGYILAREYKIKYQPWKSKPQIIIPKNDSHNTLFIVEDIIKAYTTTWLIMISNNNNQKQALHISKIWWCKLLLTKLLSGMLVEVRIVATRRMSSISNNLGIILLQLDSEEIWFEEYKESNYTWFKIKSRR